MDNSLCRTGTEVAVTYTGPEQIATLHHQLFTDNSYSSSSCSIEHKVQRIEDSSALVQQTASCSSRMQVIK